MGHLIDIEQLSCTDMKDIWVRAKEIAQGKTWVNPYKRSGACLFFLEPSTRTRCSFELAFSNKGIATVVLDKEHSSLSKGERWFDTIINLYHMGYRWFVVRQTDPGLLHRLVKKLPQDCHCINAGDGQRAHPTQVLADAYTLSEHNVDFSKMKLVIVGDILHSRVANSWFEFAKKMKTSSVHAVGPASFLPKDIEGVSFGTSLDLIYDADVIISLRIQHERLGSEFKDISAYHAQYGITKDHLLRCKQHVKLLHPGPVNIGVEMSEDVIEEPCFLGYQQVRSGVLVREAILEYVSRET